jgi:hypothetical protein
VIRRPAVKLAGTGASMSHAFDPSKRFADLPHRPTGHRRAHAPSAPRRGEAAGDYALAVAGRQVRLGPVAFWIVV